MKDTFTITDEVISKKLHDLGFPIMNPLSASNIINCLQSADGAAVAEGQLRDFSLLPQMLVIYLLIFRSIRALKRERRTSSILSSASS